MPKSAGTGFDGGNKRDGRSGATRLNGNSDVKKVSGSVSVNNQQDARYALLRGCLWYGSACRVQVCCNGKQRGSP